MFRSQFHRLIQSILAFLSSHMVILTSFIVIAGYSLLIFSISARYIDHEVHNQRQELREKVDIAYNATLPIIDSFSEGLISEQETIEQIANLVSRMVYSDSFSLNYFFMGNYNGWLLVEPYDKQKELVNQKYITDSNGTHIVRELISAAKNSKIGGFASYRYFPPLSDVEQAKLSYVRPLPELECYIGTGLYLDQILESRKETLFKFIFPAFTVLFLIIIGFTILYREIKRQNVRLHASVAENERTLRALKESEHRLELSLQATGLGIFDWDISTDVVTYDKRWLDMLEFAKNELPENLDGLLSRIHPDCRNSVEKALGDHIIGKTDQFECEYKIRSKYGRYIWVLARGAIVERDENNNGSRLIGTHLNINDEKEALRETKNLQQQLETAQKIESVGRLAGGVAHDFNNLLVPIMGYSELAEVLVGKNPKAKEALQQIQKAAESAKGLTTQLLAFSRHHAIRFRALNLNTEICEINKMLGRLLGENIHIRMDLTEDHSCIMADQGQIQQILMNLAVNARDAMSKGGILTIKTTSATITEELVSKSNCLKCGPGIKLSISDTGVGIDQKIVDKIFDPFFTTKQAGKGTGLGLATVFNIVQKHKGHIEVHSTPGHGTTFSVYFPLTEEDEAQFNNNVNVTLPDAHGESILVVEDDNTVREMIARILEESGFVVHAFGEAESAIAFYEETSDIISYLVSDVIMPGMNGRELYQKLITMNKNLRVLFVSGYTDDILASQGMLEQQFSLLQKPFTIHEFRQRLAELRQITPEIVMH